MSLFDPSGCRRAVEVLAIDNLETALRKLRAMRATGPGLQARRRARLGRPGLRPRHRTRDTASD